MGEPIRKTAARDDIFHDLKKTYDNAAAREVLDMRAALRARARMSRQFENYLLATDPLAAVLDGQGPGTDGPRR